jgi:hypothetical protein
VWWPIPAKRTLWSKETINKNYLLNIIHHQKVRAIPLPRPPRRPLKNVTAQISPLVTWFIYHYPSSDRDIGDIVGDSDE